MNHTGMELQKETQGAVSPAENVKKQEWFSPRTDIFESKDALIVMMELPGVDERNLDITVENRVLTVMATHPVEKFEGYQLVYSEYETGGYERSFTLSEDVDTQRIEAVVKNGVLRLVLPKAEQAKPRRIQVSTAE